MQAALGRDEFPRAEGNVQYSTGCCPIHFFAGSETFFDKSKARSRQFQNSPFGLKQLESLFFHFAKIYKQKTFQ
jgi:hypothetical protein